MKKRMMLLGLLALITSTAFGCSTSKMSEDETLKEGQYYLLMYNNNYGVSNTREYFPNNTETLKFKRFLVKELDAMEDEAEIVTKIIQRKICGDCQIEDLFDVLDDFGLIDDEDNSFLILTAAPSQKPLTESPILFHLMSQTQILSIMQKNIKKMKI